jgi:hypothetical protein
VRAAQTARPLHGPHRSVLRARRSRRGQALCVRQPERARHAPAAPDAADRPTDAERSRPAMRPPPPAPGQVAATTSATSSGRLARGARAPPDPTTRLACATLRVAAVVVPSRGRRRERRWRVQGPRPGRQRAPAGGSFTEASESSSIHLLFPCLSPPAARHFRPTPETPRLPGDSSSGANRDRTGDLLLAKSPRRGSATGQMRISPVDPGGSLRLQIGSRRDHDRWRFDRASMPPTQPVR